MKNIILQQDEKDCGVACLAMILKHYKTEIPLHKLRELSGTDLDGTSVFGLKKALENLNFNCLAIQADNELWSEKELPLPLIAHVIIDNKYPHYVVVYDIKDTELMIADPGRGKIKKTVTEFNKEWTSVVLIPTPKEIYPALNKQKQLFTAYIPSSEITRVKVNMPVHLKIDNKGVKTEILNGNLTQIAETSTPTDKGELYLVKGAISVPKNLDLRYGITGELSLVIGKKTYLQQI